MVRGPTDTPSPSKGREAGPAADKGIVDQRQAVDCDLLAHHVLEKTGLASDRRAIDGGNHVPDQAAGGPRVKHHSDVGTGLDLTRVHTCGGTLSGALADRLGFIKIGKEYAAVEIIVALHLHAFAGNDADRAGKAGPFIGAGEAVRGRQHHAEQAGSGARTDRAGNTRHRQRCRFGGRRSLDQAFRGRFGGVVQFKVGPGFGQHLCVGKAGMRIFGRHPRHCHRTLRQCAFIGSLARVDRRHLLADKNPQAEIIRFGRLGILDLAIAHGSRARAAANHQRIRLVGTSRPGSPDETLSRRQQAFRLLCITHVFWPFAWLSCIVATVKHQARLGSSRRFNVKGAQ
jgi:hypothetical protein